MSCYDPLLAVDFGVDPETQKHRVKILPKRVDFNLDTLRARYGNSLLLLPCGKCIGCIQDYKNSWAVRILLEASLYERNCFITLTYSDNCLPSDNRPHRDEIVKFFKRLRKKIGVPIRYFYCGEKGDKSGRAHYHAIIFGYDFPDKVVHGRTAKGSIIYKSSTLSDCWHFGLSSIGEVEPGSACYVAQYSDKKKLSGEDDGSFIGMSRMPGLGCDKFNLRWFQSDTIYCALGEATIPRFFHKLLEGLAPEYYEHWKKARKDRASQKIGDQYIHGMREEEAYLYNERVKLTDYIRKARSVL